MLLLFLLVLSVIFLLNASKQIKNDTMNSRPSQFSWIKDHEYLYHFVYNIYMRTIAFIVIIFIRSFRPLYPSAFIIGMFIRLTYKEFQAEVFI